MRPFSVLFLFLGWSVCAAGAEARPERLIWITMDTLRADHLGYMGYGKDTSPWLDAFARESVDFRRAIAPSNVTRWSVAAYFTGKYSRDLVDVDPPLYIPSKETTVAELLQSAGFHTAGWTANAQIPDGLGYEHGFDEYRVVLPRSQPHASIDELLYDIRGSYSRSGGPEFVYVHAMDVHAPWRPPIPFDREFAPYYDRGVVNEGSPRDFYGRHVLSTHPYYSETHDMNELDKEFVVSQYDGLIRYMDSRLAELMEILEYDPERDMVVFTSDHGEAFFEHLYLEHGRHVLSEEIHVPLLIRLPGAAPARRDYAVSLMDLMPTIADVFGLKTPKGLAGRSLAADLQAPANPGRFVISEHSHRAVAAAAVVGEGHLYRMNATSHFRYPWRVWPYLEELYDLDADPLCATNIIERERGRADRMNDALRAQDPKYAPYTRERLRGPTSPIKFGPDVLPAEIEWIQTPSAVTPQKSGALTLERPEPLLYLEAQIDEPGHAYLVEVEYRLSSGALTLKLQDSLYDVFRRVYSESWIIDEHTAWDYVIFKPSSEFRKVRSVVYPRANAMYFIAAMERPGRAEIRSVRLRRLLVPEIPGVPPVLELPPEGNRSAEAGLTPELINRLESLGYIE